MPELQFYDKLLQFPMFQGLSRNDLTQIAGHTKLDFIKVEPGKKIVKEGDTCTRLLLMAGGKALIKTSNYDYSYTITEHIDAPFVIQSEHLFGSQQRFHSTFVANTTVNIIAISKEEVMTLIDKIFVFRLNMLNFFATTAQKSMRQAWHRRPENLRAAIINFIATRCQYPAGHKNVKILMERLALELNDSRLNVSRALNALQADGLITLRRGQIEIERLERLLSK